MESFEFTNEEKQRIDVLYGTDFADIKPEDAALIARWEQYKAVNDAEAKAKTEALKSETEANIAQSKKTAEKARKSLNELKKAAIARLERLQ